MKKVWHDEAWEDYLYWQAQDKKTLKKQTDSSVILTETAINALESQRHYPEILLDFGVSG